MKKLFALLTVLLVAGSVNAQDDMFGVVSIETTDQGAVIYGDTTLALDAVVTLTLEDGSGNYTEADAFVSEDGSLLAIVGGETSVSGLASVTASSPSTGALLGFGAVFVDTEDLGDDWVPQVMPTDPHDPAPGGCSDKADEIHTELGGSATIYSIQSKDNEPGETHQYPLGGTYRGHPTGYFFHDVVVKNGKVYDGFGDRDGMPIDEWKNLWSNKDHIDFGF
jgi:hypothetical protein